MLKSGYFHIFTKIWTLPDELDQPNKPFLRDRHRGTNPHRNCIGCPPAASAAVGASKPSTSSGDGEAPPAAAATGAMGMGDGSPRMGAIFGKSLPVMYPAGMNNNDVVPITHRQQQYPTSTTSNYQCPPPAYPRGKFQSPPPLFSPSAPPHLQHFLTSYIEQAKNQNQHLLDYLKLYPTPKRDGEVPPSPISPPPSLSLLRERLQQPQPQQRADTPHEIHFSLFTVSS